MVVGITESTGGLECGQNPGNTPLPETTGLTLPPGTLRGPPSTTAVPAWLPAAAQAWALTLTSRPQG